MTNETPILNEHNKAEYPPMHTRESGVSFTLQKIATEANGTIISKELYSHCIFY